MKMTSLPISYSFNKKGTVQCKVTSGSVTIQLDTESHTYSAEQQGRSRKFQKTRKKDSDPTCEVHVSATDSKAKIVFTGP